MGVVFRSNGFETYDDDLLSRVDRIREEAQQDMWRLEREQREHEDFRERRRRHAVARARRRRRARGRGLRLRPGEGLTLRWPACPHPRVPAVAALPAARRALILHGQVKAGRNLRVARGTCDPFVKVSYVPPSEDGATTSLSLRAKQKVHATEVLYDTSSPLWAENMFRLDVEAPLSMHADDQDGEDSDWDKLRGLVVRGLRHQ